MWWPSGLWHFASCKFAPPRFWFLNETLEKLSVHAKNLLWLSASKLYPMLHSSRPPIIFFPYSYLWSARIELVTCRWKFRTMRDDGCNRLSNPGGKAPIIQSFVSPARLLYPLHLISMNRYGYPSSCGISLDLSSRLPTRPRHQIENPALRTLVPC